MSAYKLLGATLLLVVILGVLLEGTVVELAVDLGEWMSALLEEHASPF